MRAATSGVGTNRTSGDVRYPVANGGKPDLTRTGPIRSRMNPVPAVEAYGPWHPI